MSKSLGNILLISELRKQYSPEAMRYVLLSGHYRQPLDFSQAAIAQAKTTLDRLYGALRDLADIQPIASIDADSILECLCDDLNTPKALAELNALAREAQKAEGQSAKALAKARLLAAGELLGLLTQEPSVWFQGEPSNDAEAARFDALLEQRRIARANKDFARADAIRAEFAAAGIVVEDTPQGARWKRA